jgi:hypothetical protein
MRLFGWLRLKRVFLKSGPGTFVTPPGVDRVELTVLGPGASGTMSGPKEGHPGSYSNPITYYVGDAVGGGGGGGPSSIGHESTAFAALSEPDSVGGLDEMR